jgi:hypothetical protein
VRDPIRIIADVLALAREARRDGASIPIELALEGRLEKRWRELEEEMKKILAERPS